MDTTLQVTQALLTMVIGCITAYIAWNQYTLNRDKGRLDKYDRRLKLYQEVVALLDAAAKGDVSDDELKRFVRNTAEADFLFPNDEVPSYLKMVQKQATNLCVAKRQYRDDTQENPPGYDHQQICENMHTASRWLAEQDEEAKSRFMPYMRLAT